MQVYCTLEDYVSSSQISLPSFSQFFTTLFIIKTLYIQAQADKSDTRTASLCGRKYDRLKGVK